jgi:dipeptidyl aminopeptidase/acylaminoacyl peptidase
MSLILDPAGQASSPEGARDMRLPSRLTSHRVSMATSMLAMLSQRASYPARSGGSCGAEQLRRLAKARLELRVQLFTSRGFAVLDVDDGGSTGYGRADRERLTGQWGVVDVDDCLQAARQLVTSGQVDPDRIAIVGASAGGYTALRALATSDLFATAVSYHGIADLETFRMQAPKYRAPQLDRLIGPYPDAAEVYRARSPLQQAGLLRRPVLGLHAAEDPVVPAMQAEAMARALQRRGVPHRLLVFPAQGHGCRGEATIRQALEAARAFYQEMPGR